MKHTDLRLTRMAHHQEDNHARVLMHLRRLSEDDLALRFGLARVKDETLVSYVRGLDFERDVVLAMRDPMDEVVALAHAARYEVGRATEREARAEVSFSVVPAHRGCGLARRLMQAIIEVAAEAGVERLFAQCVSANRPMRAVFARSGWSMEVDGSEVLAALAVRSVAAAHVHPT
ncbi:MAG: N-acetyltransferase family protein [Burkholderiaceae bacterium]